MDNVVIYRTANGAVISCLEWMPEEEARYRVLGFMLQKLKSTENNTEDEHVPLEREYDHTA